VEDGTDGWGWAFEPTGRAPTPQGRMLRVVWARLRQILAPPKARPAEGTPCQKHFPSKARPRRRHGLVEGWVFGPKGAGHSDRTGDGHSAQTSRRHPTPVDLGVSKGREGTGGWDWAFARSSEGRLDRTAGMK
jgi:hypothetical protein